MTTTTQVTHALTLAFHKDQRSNVTTNRSMIKRTFERFALCFRTFLNSKDLLTIMKWNKENNIHFYRMSSDLILGFEYELNQLPDYDAIAEVLYEVGFMLRKTTSASQLTLDLLTN